MTDTVCRFRVLQDLPAFGLEAGDQLTVQFGTPEVTAWVRSPDGSVTVRDADDFGPANGFDQALDTGAVVGLWKEAARQGLRDSRPRVGSAQS